MNSNFDVFISYNAEDYQAVTTLAERLKQQALQVFFDRWHLIPGQPWPERLIQVLQDCSAVAICIGPGEMGLWQQREMHLALERQNQEPGFPVIPVLLPGANPSLDFLSQNMWVDFRGGIDEPLALNMLKAAIRGESLDEAIKERLQETINSICPYRGLHYFREQDAGFFFGRDQAITELQNKLQDHPFVALVGASGSGKSSVIRAGLLSQLRKQIDEPWEIITIVPGDRPLYNLAAGLMPLLEPELGENALLIETDTQAKALLQGSLQIRDVIQRILQKQAGTAHFLLVVDQWEELYTVAAKASRDEEPNREKNINQVRRFIDGLLDACDAHIMHVVITLRGDFMGEVIAYRRLSDVMQNAQINLGPMTQEELRLAIEKPAQKVNIDFEPGLVDTLLTDVGDEPGNLPLLEFVLDRLWRDENRHGGSFRHRAYQDMNKLKGALADKADDIYNKKVPQDQCKLRQIMLRLVHSSEQSKYSRRRASYDELGEDTEQLINELIEERLVISNQGQKNNQKTLEVTHEALFSDWPLMQQWLLEDRDFLWWRQRLYGDLKEWQQTHQGLNGQRLSDARRWLRMRKKELCIQEQQFIRHSIRQMSYRRFSWVAAIVLPVSLAASFIIWINHNGLSSKLGWHVLLAKTDQPWLFPEPEMVTIPPTNCQLQGCSDEKKEKLQHFDQFQNPFKIGRYEVTIDEYQLFDYMVEKEGGCLNFFLGEQYKKGYVNDQGWGRGDRPVINVRWHDAQCYVKWLSKKTGKHYRLPTKAEWEFATRGGTKTLYYWGDDEDLASAYAWHFQNSDGKTHPVGLKKPNAFGLYDTVGNVQEWVQDCWHEENNKLPVSVSSFNNSDCVIRLALGGSWNSNTQDLRSSNRGGGHHMMHIPNIGLRLAQDIN